MKHISIAVMLAAMMSILLITEPVRGQTASPNPSATPTPTPIASATPIPGSAEDIATKALAAVVAADSYHYTQTVKLSAPGVLKESSQAHGDQSLKNSTAHVYLTQHLTTIVKKQQKAQLVREEMILVKTTAAVRTRKKAPWKCVDLTPLAKTLGQIFGGQSGSTGSGGTPTIQVSYQFASPDTTTLNGTDAWHIQVSMSTPGLSSVAAIPLEDLYVSKADNTILREATSLHMKLALPVNGKKKTIKLTESMVENFSSYGEPLSITLPAACPASTARLGPFRLTQDPRLQVVRDAAFTQLGARLQG